MQQSNTNRKGTTCQKHQITRDTMGVQKFAARGSYRRPSTKSLSTSRDRYFRPCTNECSKYYCSPTLSAASRGSCFFVVFPTIKDFSTRP